MPEKTAARKLDGRIEDPGAGETNQIGAIAQLSALAGGTTKAPGFSERSKRTWPEWGSRKPHPTAALVSGPGSVATRSAWSSSGEHGMQGAP